MIFLEKMKVKCERCGREFEVDKKWLERYKTKKTGNPNLKILCAACVFCSGQRYEYHYFGGEYIGESRPSP